MESEASLRDRVSAAGLAPPEVAPEATGRGLRIAVVDSGVNFGHPHLRSYLGPKERFSIYRDERQLEVQTGDAADLFGHGTCCAALLHFLAPEAELVAIRITGERMRTDADLMSEGILQAVRCSADLISVAFGTQTRLRAGLDDAVAEAQRANAVVIAAYPGQGEVLPARCAGALAAEHEDGVDVKIRAGRVWAEGRARPAQGHKSNFWGCSLSTSRVTAALARFAQERHLRGQALVEGFSKELDVR